MDLLCFCDHFWRSILILTKERVSLFCGNKLLRREIAAMSKTIDDAKRQEWKSKVTLA